MSKKIISAIILILCVCFILSGCDNIGTFMGIEGDEIEYSIENGEATVVKVPNKETITKVVIPDEYEGVPVTKIADFSVVNLEYVDAIHIGKNVKEIGDWALENNQKVTKFTVDKENEYFCDVDGVLFTKDMKTLLFYPIAKDLQDELDDKGQVKKDDYGNNIKYSVYTIPDGVEVIHTKAFYKCYPLKTIAIPDSVKRIEEKAFFRCGKVKNFLLPTDIEFIGKDAFAFCEGINKIIIGDNIKQIDDYAFYNCKNVSYVFVNRAESEITCGEKWYPTFQGKDIENLEIVWKNSDAAT